MVPRSSLIKGVQLQDRDPVAGGGFADIFRASYNGQLVALKRLRNFRDSPVSRSEENVGSISWTPFHADQRQRKPGVSERSLRLVVSGSLEHPFLHGDRHHHVLSSALYRLPLAGKWRYPRLVGALRFSGSSYRCRRTCMFSSAARGSVIHNLSHRSDGFCSAWVISTIMA